MPSFRVPPLDRRTGGIAPLGYDRVDHQLVANPPEAETVREIFLQDLRLGCVKELRNANKIDLFAVITTEKQKRRLAGGENWIQTHG